MKKIKPYLVVYKDLCDLCRCLHKVLLFLVFSSVCSAGEGNPLVKQKELSQAVTRSFGQLPESERQKPGFEVDFKAGQMAYYFSDYKQAYVHWKPLADSGHADAQANLGWLYQMGLGLNRNLEQASLWYHKAAKHGQAVAQNNLGVMYEQGLFHTKDIKQAIYLYRRSAENGYRYGQYNLAVQLDSLKQISEANSWYIQAAQQGVEAAGKILEQRNIDYKNKK